MYFSLILNRYVYHAALVKRKLIANPKLRHLVASLRLADGDQSDERPDQPQRPRRLTIDQLVSDAKSVAKTSNKKTTSFFQKRVHPTKEQNAHRSDRHKLPGTKLDGIKRWPLFSTRCSVDLKNPT